MSRHIKKVKDILIFDKNKVNNILHKIDKLYGTGIIAIYNSENIGITSSTKDLFKKENTLGLKEVLNKKEIEIISNKLATSNIDQIVFSSMTFGYISIIKKIKFLNNNIKISVYWHGSYSMLVQRDEDYFLYNIIELMNLGIIDKVAFAKESMAKYYKIKGYNSYFLPNTVSFNNCAYGMDENNENINDKKNNNDKIKIGLYSAGNRWEKNTFNQLSSISLIKNAVVDVIPCNKLVKDFCKQFNIKLLDSKIKYLSRDKFIEKLSLNNINLYVTFTECSPMLPLESFESGTVCITGNNHHYFKGYELLEKTIVKSEDNINEIKEKIEYAIENKIEILEEYKKWKKEYDVFCIKKIQDFIDN